MDAQALHAAVAAVCPIDGVALSAHGAPWPTVASPDGSLWRIDYQASAADAQRAAARGIVAAWSAAAIPPDCGSLAFWLTALDLWQRTDGAGDTGPATAQVQKQIAALIAAGNPLGTLAQRQFNNANTVLRLDLLRIAPAFGFTPADCDESLWRANRIALGDYSGTWPLPKV